MPEDNDPPKGKKPPNPGSGDEHPPTKRTCGTMNVHRRLLNTSERYRQARERIEEAAFRAESMLTAQRSGCTEIPVVVHVVYRNAAENISDAQIESQIKVLNEDFRKKNSDVSHTPAPFAPLTGDARVTFKLATVDPDGNATDGITRTHTTAAGFTDDDAVKSAATGGADPWPSNEYLNLWVCQLLGGLLGYAQFPGGPAETDGVVIRQSAFGTTGTATAPFNLGRTATHEIGHWLNLRHIWGDDGDGCGGSDFVADTPNQGGPNTGMPTFPKVSCSNGPNGDMFMNYMDYTDDAGMFMFTAGQVTRMQACLDGARSTIGHSVPCGVVKPPSKDGVKDGIKDGPKDQVKDHPKDQIKDHPKDGVKDSPKDGIKDVLKDIIKDPPKEFVKERIKDLIKDRPKEAVLDPAKPPVSDLPGFGGGIGPVVNPAVPIGAQPFVLGGAFGGAAPTGRDAGDARAQLEQSYALILGGFAQLASAGLLDQAGQAVYAQLLASYQALSGGQE